MSSSLVAYAAALGLAAAIPGRGVAALVGQLLGSGLRSGLFLLAGIPAGDVVYLTVAVAGLAGIAQAFAGIFLIVKILGGAYLLFLALKLWGGKVGPQAVGASRKGTGFGVFLTGFSVTMGNPKTIVFYLVQPEQPDQAAAWRNCRPCVCRMMARTTEIIVASNALRWARILRML